MKQDFLIAYDKSLKRELWVRPSIVGFLFLGGGYE